MKLIQPIIEDLKELARQTSEPARTDEEEAFHQSEIVRLIDDLEDAFSGTFGPEHGHSTKIKRVGHQIRAAHREGALADLQSLGNALNETSKRT